MKKEGIQKSSVLFAVFFVILLITSVAMVSAESGNNENIFSKVWSFIKVLFGGQSSITGAGTACDPYVDPSCVCDNCIYGTPGCITPCCDSTCTSEPWCCEAMGGDIPFEEAYCNVEGHVYNDLNSSPLPGAAVNVMLVNQYGAFTNTMGSTHYTDNSGFYWESDIPVTEDDQITAEVLLDTGDISYPYKSMYGWSIAYPEYSYNPQYCSNGETLYFDFRLKKDCVPTSSSEAGYCDDEIDNDCDGLIDCEEILYEDGIPGNDDCADDPICGIVSGKCGNGYSDEGEECDYGNPDLPCCTTKCKIIDTCGVPRVPCPAGKSCLGNGQCENPDGNWFTSKKICEFNTLSASYTLEPGCGNGVHTLDSNPSWSFFETGTESYCCGDDNNEFFVTKGDGQPGCCTTSGSNICVSSLGHCGDEWNEDTSLRKETKCDDGIDNDCDGVADLNDSDCVYCGNNNIDSGEDCDPGQDVEGDCCTSECKFVSSGTECRVKDGACDVAEVCSGSNATCPSDDVMSSGDHDCPACQTCDGTNKNCTSISGDEDTTGSNVCNSSCDYCATGTSGNKECKSRPPCYRESSAGQGRYCDGNGLHEDYVNVDDAGNSENGDNIAFVCSMCAKDSLGNLGQHTYGATWSIFSGTGTEAHCCGDDTEFFITRGNGQPGCCNESKTTTCVSSLGHCGNTFGVAEISDINCNDGIDNDCNGYADADDPNCSSCGDGKITGDEKCDPGIAGQECCIPKGQPNQCNGALTVCTAASGCSTGKYCVGGTNYGCAAPSDTGVEGKTVCEAECGGGINPPAWYHVEGNSFPFYSNLATVSNFGAPCCGDAGIKEAYITNGNGQPGCCAIGSQLVSNICVSSLGYCGGEYTGKNTGNTDNPASKEITCNDGKDNDCDGVYDNNFVMGPNGDIYPDPDCAGKGRQYASTTDWDGDLLVNLAEGWDENDPRVAVFSDSDTQPDFIDIDSDGDGIMDDFEAFENCEYPETCPISDKDADGVYDFRDLDTDADGISDLTEGHDADSNGIVDRVPSGNDINQNGLDAAFDPEEGGVLAPLQDIDGDGTPDWRDADDDGDGILTIDEGTGDFDGDGTPDYLDDDSDNDGVVDDVDKCLESIANYAEALKSNHYDSSNLNLTETFGCNLDQILFCKPGNNDGEYKFGLTIGTLNVWTSQTGWALDCQVDSIVALEGEAKPFFENTDNSGLIDIFDGDNDNDGIVDSEDSEDDSAPVESGFEGTGKPDWWCDKHPNKC